MNTAEKVEPVPASRTQVERHWRKMGHHVDEADLKAIERFWERMLGRDGLKHAHAVPPRGQR